MAAELSASYLLARLISATSINFYNSLNLLARPARFERAAFAFGGQK